MPATRQQRLQETLRAELSEIIRREMRDPRFNEGLLSITDVKVTADLKQATVFYSFLGDDEARKHAANALRGAKGVLKGELGRRKMFNNVPDLTFKYDDAIDRGNKMFELLEQIKREDALRPKPPEAEIELESESDEENA